MLWFDMSVIFPDSLKGLTIWRYMSLEKMLDVFRTGSLHFAALNSFRDPYEGAVPIGWRGPVTDLSNLPDSIDSSSDSSKWHSIDIDVGGGEFFKDQKIGQELYVSCWHANEGQSAAMWSLYSKDSGIAIRTTTEHLRDALLNWQREVELAAVEYLESVPRFMCGKPWTIKRPSFKHENEVRAAIREPASDSRGLLISVDVETLVGEILVSPDSPEWIEEVVRDVVAKYGLNKTVRRSDLYTLT
jgi:hypothetical protein